MKKHYTEFTYDFSGCAQFGNLHLWFPPKVLAQIDKAMELQGVRTREDFATLSVLYTLKSLREDAGTAVLGLEVSPSE